MKVVQQKCKKCLLDYTVSDIWFDEGGVCKYCMIHNEMYMQYLKNRAELKISEIILRLKKAGKGKKYDCIVGVSGGRDSTYSLYYLNQMGIRPLAVHFDNGWNSDISTKNIKLACDKLGIDLITHVADWENFRDLQVSFLRASVSDADIPTDYAIYSLLYETAQKEKIKYIINGHSFLTEGTTPISWTYMDYRYIRDVHKKFGRSKNLSGIPLMPIGHFIYYVIFKRIREVRLLELIDYNQEVVTSLLEKELNWSYYGGHHHENNYTKFFQSYYLPKKFNIDKRKVELSALIRSGQIIREEGLAKISETYPYDEDLIAYVRKKLDTSAEEFAEIMNAPLRNHRDFKTYLPLIRLLKIPIKVAASMQLLPKILYLKYAKSK